MAKLIILSKDILRISSFFKSRPGPSKSRIKNDACFESLRRNNREFGHACKSGSLLRKSVMDISWSISDNKVSGRLMQLMLRAAKADVTNPPGCRNVVDGNLHLLEGFNFNDNARLDRVFKSDYETSIDRPGGELRITIPSLMPKRDLEKPVCATHMKVISAAAEVDFLNNTFEHSQYESDFIQLNSRATGMISIVHQLSANSQHPLFLLLGISFYIKVNDDYEQAGGSAANSLSIVAVSTS